MPKSSGRAVENCTAPQRFLDSAAAVHRPSASKTALRLVFALGPRIWPTCRPVDRAVPLYRRGWRRLWSQRGDTLTFGAGAGSASRKWVTSPPRAPGPRPPLPWWAGRRPTVLWTRQLSSHRCRRRTFDQCPLDVRSVRAMGTHL